MKNLMPFILIIVSVGVFFIFLDPQYQEIKKVQQTIKENDVMIENGKQLERQKNDLSNTYKNISVGDKERMIKLLPDTVDNVRLVLDINNIAEDFGITITNIGIKEDEQKEANASSRIVDTTTNKYGTIELSFSATTTYETFKDFIKKLEDSLRLVDITSISVSTTKGLFNNYTVTLKTYWLR